MRGSHCLCRGVEGRQRIGAFGVVERVQLNHLRPTRQENQRNLQRHAIGQDWPWGAHLGAQILSNTDPPRNHLAIACQSRNEGTGPAANGSGKSAWQTRPARTLARRSANMRPAPTNHSQNIGTWSPPIASLCRRPGNSSRARGPVLPAKTVRDFTEPFHQNHGGRAPGVDLPDAKRICGCLVRRGWRVGVTGGSSSSIAD